MSDKAVVLLSGGIDSTVLLYKMHAEGLECHPLTIDYGQRHDKEVIAAMNVCEQKSAELLRRWKLANLSVLGSLLPSALTYASAVPEGPYTPETQALTVVPNRNMILLAIAAGYAEGLKARYVAYAAHRNDSVVYPDCRPTFVYAMERAIDRATGGAVELWAPFVQSPKDAIVKLGVTHRVPFKLTWSCYQGREKHCGRCGTCIERMGAFHLAGVADPTEYEALILDEAHWLFDRSKQ